MNNRWGWRTRCKECKYIGDPHIYPSGSKFWASCRMCSRCAGSMEMVTCRYVYKPNSNYKIWNPLTWFGTYVWETK